MDFEQNQRQQIEVMAMRTAKRVSVAERAMRDGREHWIKACKDISSALLVVAELSIDVLLDAHLL